MKLSVYERLILLNILPKEGNFTTLKTVRVLKERLSFDDEFEELNFHDEFQCEKCGALVVKPFSEPPGSCPDCGGRFSPTGRRMWNQTADKEKEIDLEIDDDGAKAKKLIAKILKQLDKEERLTDEHYSLYVKFVGEE